MPAIFEKMVEDFRKKDTEQLLDECMHPDVNIIKKIPLRYRLIAYGFMKNLTLEELEHKLIENGCETLYARNPIEASLIYAFSRKMKFEEWKALEEKERAVSAKLETKWFKSSGVTYKELEQYVLENSEISDGTMQTAKVTHKLKDKIENYGTEEEFLQFLETNRQDFSLVREKARYYYCKYLKMYIDEKIEKYIIAEKTGFGVEQAAMELNVLKCAVLLRKKQPDEGKLKEKLSDTTISFGNIYDAFNYFYFGYITMDWLEVLLEYYGNDIDKMNSAQKEKLARGIRAYERDWNSMSDDEVIQLKLKQEEEKEEKLDEEYALIYQDDIAGNRGYQKNRSGEKSVRNYIKGIADLDRTTLICYLIFFGQNIEEAGKEAITKQRLDHILMECGYAPLREKDDFDHFLIQYFMADDRVDFLMESVTKSAIEEKNFYFYHMYHGAGSEDKKLKNLL